MIGINRKDIQAILKAGAKTKGMSTSEFKAEIQATIDNIINSSDIEEQKPFYTILWKQNTYTRGIYLYDYKKDND